MTIGDQSSALRRRLQLVQLAFDALKMSGFNHPPHLAQAPNQRAPSLMVEPSGLHLAVDARCLTQQPWQRGEPVAPPLDNAGGPSCLLGGRSISYYVLAHLINTFRPQ